MTQTHTHIRQLRSGCLVDYSSRVYHGLQPTADSLPTGSTKRAGDQRKGTTIRERRRERESKCDPDGAYASEIDQEQAREAWTQESKSRRRIGEPSNKCARARAREREHEKDKSG
eukprot:3736314-Pleurochrysis_carterae.AAC.1